MRTRRNAFTTPTMWPRRGSPWPRWPTPTSTPGPSRRSIRRTPIAANLQGFAKDEVIIPAHSRNVYDAAIRAVGVRVVTVSTVAELEAAIGPRTALIYVLAGPEADKSELSVKAMGPIAKAQGRADPGRRRRRDPDHPQRPPARRRHARRLQRRQVPARSAGRGPAARPQGSGQGGLGPQRAAPWPASRLQGRQGRSDRDAGRGRGLGEARPRRRVEALDRLARAHRGEGEDRRRRDHRDSPSPPACRTGRRRSACAGIAPRSASMARPSSARCSTASRASP